MSDKKKKTQQLTDAELEKAAGGMRGPGSVDEATGMEGRLEATPNAMGNRPIDISRRVQGSWIATKRQSGGPTGAEEINERP